MPSANLKIVWRGTTIQLKQEGASWATKSEAEQWSFTSGDLVLQTTTFVRTTSDREKNAALSLEIDAFSTFSKANAMVIIDGPPWPQAREHAVPMMQNNLDQPPTFE